MVDTTLRCICAGMLELLQEKEYSDIQMMEIAQRARVGRRTLYRYFDSKELILKYIAESLMDRFADEIAQTNEMTLYSVMHAFFLFIGRNRDEFVLLKKARLLGYVEEPLFALVTQVATKARSRDPQQLRRPPKAPLSEDQYALQFTIAGAWRIAMLWLEDEQALSPEQLAQITGRIMRRN